VLRDALFDLAHTFERLVPPPFEFIGDEPVLWVGSIVLALGAVRCIAGRLQIALKSAAHFVLLVHLISVRQDRGLDSGGLHDTQYLRGNGFIDPCTTEADTARLTFVEPGTVTGIACYITLTASVVHGELRCATPAAKQTGQDGAACAGCPVMTGGERKVRVDRALNALEALPVDIALVRVRDQREPLFARFSAIALTWLPTDVTRAALALAVRVGAAVDRVREHLIHRAVDRPLPVNLPTGRDRWKLQAVLMEPQ
jgi:hypothetical protein